MVRGGSSLPVDRSNKGEGRMERCLVPFALRHSHEEVGFVLGRSGNDLLSRVLRHSTIGAEEFNGRVRDGIGFLAPRSNHRTGEGQLASKGRMGGGEWRMDHKTPVALRHTPFAVFLFTP